ncbi:MAG: hypothetical protein KBA14_02830 [Saprospiraceae bacterium]|nr:hypothetical protein [Saprospiraceae bacterium]
MKRIPFIIVMLALCFASQMVNAQVSTDTIVIDTVIKKEKKGSFFEGRPGKSMLMSLVIPGAGQIYNKSYIRVPFVWGAVGGMGYLVHYNTLSYQCLKSAYEASIDGIPYSEPCANCDDDIKFITNPSQLKVLRDDANEARQLSIVGFTLVWLANGIDAFVDAHLKDFDIDDNLSIDIGSRVDDDPHAPMRIGIFVQF